MEKALKIVQLLFFPSFFKKNQTTNNMDPYVYQRKKNPCKIHCINIKNIALKFTVLHEHHKN